MPPPPTPRTNQQRWASLIPLPPLPPLLRRFVILSEESTPAGTQQEHQMLQENKDDAVEWRLR